jgi:dUTP pyrophosphatase
MSDLKGFKHALVHVKKLHPLAQVPEYQTDGSAACDLSSVEDVWLGPGTRTLVHTGIAIQADSPRNYEFQIRPRSGLALKHGLTVLNSPGTVDDDFRGEMMVLLHNTSDHWYLVEAGDRIAQMVMAPVTRAVFDVVDELNETDRNAGGWGFTGTK